MKESDDDPDVTTALLQNDIKEVYRDCVFGLNKDDRKMMIVMMLYDKYTTQFDQSKTTKAVEVTQVLDINEKKHLKVASRVC